MHRDVDAAVEQRVVNLLGEQALAADVGERLVEDLVAGGLDDHDLQGALLGKLREVGLGRGARGEWGERAGEAGAEARRAAGSGAGAAGRGGAAARGMWRHGPRRWGRAGALAAGGGAWTGWPSAR
jgi:hypothetical protein